MARLFAALLLLLVAFPANAQGLEELRLLVEADQKDRTNDTEMSQEQLRAMAARDRERRARVRKLILADALKDAIDFDRAALIYQHGDQQDDYEVARELSILAFSMGRINSLPALSEDRFLQAIGRAQRFGTQFTLGPDGALKLGSIPDSKAPTAVSDALRLDFLQPPLGVIEKEGMKAYEVGAPLIAARLDQRWNREFLAVAASSASAVELRALAATRHNAASRARVLELYVQDALSTPEDYVNAARILTSASETPTRLLANEFAALAAMRGHPHGGRVFAETWDRFIGGIGRPSRYGTRGSEVVRASTGPAVRRFLGLDGS